MNSEQPPTGSDGVTSATLATVLAPHGAQGAFFDHRREYARTDWARDGLPIRDWEALLAQARQLAREAGFLAYALPGEYGGGDASNLDMAVVREHLASRGIGLHCDLQNEHSIAGNSHHKQFEHHYRHHRRYRIAEGSDEIQLRKIAGHLFGFIGGR